MKKNFIFSALLFSGILISCGKSEIKTTNDAVNSDANGETTVTKSPPLNELLFARIKYDDGTRPGVEGETYGCKDVGGYCGPNNILRAIDVPVINEILDEGAPKYKENFQSHQSQLAEIFGAELTAGVADGTLTLDIVGHIGGVNHAYFSFIKGNQTISVKPVGF